MANSNPAMLPTGNGYARPGNVGTTKGKNAPVTFPGAEKTTANVELPTPPQDHPHSR